MSYSLIYEDQMMCHTLIEGEKERCRQILVKLALYVPFFLVMPEACCRPIAPGLTFKLQ